MLLNTTYPQKAKLIGRTFISGSLLGWNTPKTPAIAVKPKQNIKWKTVRVVPKLVKPKFWNKCLLIKIVPTDAAMFNRMAPATPSKDESAVDSLDDEVVSVMPPCC